MFIGRAEELNALNKLYIEEKFQFVVMYGRRRVGKTTLLTEFCKNKEAIFFVAEEHNDKMTLENFSDRILNYFDMKDFIDSFETWEKAFLFLAKQAKEKRIVVVIDEFPYIVNANNRIPSIMQNLIDHVLKDTKLFLIVCGSSMSFMEKEVLSYKSPLYGRRTSQLKINPFDFYDSIKFFENYDYEDKIKAYGILGGIPQYLKNFDDKRLIETNIKEKLLDKATYLYEEPRSLLKQELREPLVYNSIIEVIATGSSKMNQIVTKTGEPNDKCAKYLKTLIELRIISKETPIGEKENTRKSIYRLNDNLFKFWYRFVFRNSNFIEQNLIDYMYEQEILPHINDYLGEIFEQVCKDYLIRLNRNMKLPFVFKDIGKWWGNNSKAKKEEEIDIVALNGENAILGECKWRNTKIDMEVINSLIDKGELLNYKNKYYFFFSKSDFNNEVLEFVRNNDNVYIIGLETLFNIDIDIDHLKK